VTVADTLINSVKMLAALAWLKQMDLAGHWLVQHTAPVRAKPDSRPRQEGARYKYLTSGSLLLNPAFLARHAHIAHTCSWARALDRYTVSALRSESSLGWTSARNKERRKKNASE